jgi:hypothetical protein
MAAAPAANASSSGDVSDNSSSSSSSSNSTASSDSSSSSGNITATPSSGNATVALEFTVNPGNGTVGAVRLTGVNSTATSPNLNAYLGTMLKAPLPAIDEELKEELEDRPPLNITILVGMDVADIPKLKGTPEHPHIG